MRKFHHGPDKEHVRRVLAAREGLKFSPAWEGPHNEPDPGFSEKMKRLFRLGRGQKTA